VLGQPGDTWTSQRDHLLLAMLYNTGARVSEIIGVKVSDVVLDESPCVHLRGKGRKATHDTFMEKYDSGNPGLAGTQSIIEGRCCIAAKQGRSCHDALQRYSAPQHRRGTGSQGA
jgi:Site-specific recombinase XerD